MSEFYAVSNNYLTIFEKIPRFVTHEIIVYLAKNLLNHTKDRYHVIPKIVTFHIEIVIFLFKICCITLVFNFSAHLLLWPWNSKSQLVFEMQPVTKIKYQINVCSSFIKTRRKCKCVINENIVEIATFIVIKRINLNLYKQRKSTTFRNNQQQHYCNDYWS